MFHNRLTLKPAIMIFFSLSFYSETQLLSSLLSRESNSSKREKASVNDKINNLKDKTTIAKQEGAVQVT